MGDARRSALATPAHDPLARELVEAAIGVDLVRCPAPPLLLALGPIDKSTGSGSSSHTDHSRSRNPASGEAAEQRGSPAPSTHPASAPRAIPEQQPPSLLTRPAPTAAPREAPPHATDRYRPRPGNPRLPYQLPGHRERFRRALNKPQGQGYPMVDRVEGRRRSASARPTTGRCSRTASPSRPWQVARSPLAAGREPFPTVDRRSGA